MAETVSEATRERILQAAAAAVKRQAVSVLSMQEIAEAAGVSRSSLYKAYNSKYELFADASRAVLVDQLVLIEKTVSSFQVGDDPLGALRHVLTELYRVGRDQPYAAAFLYGMLPLVEHGHVDDAVLERVRAVDHEARERLRGRVDDAILAGALSGDADKIVELSIVAAFGYIATSVNHNPLLEPEEFADYTISGLQSLSGTSGPAGLR